MTDIKETDKNKKVEDGQIEVIAGNTEIIKVKLLDAINKNLMIIIEKMGK